MNDYVEWMYDCIGDYQTKSYKRLFLELNTIQYRYINAKDKNREGDAFALRCKYCRENNVDMWVVPCTVLEMLVALALRCEEQIMSDPAYGNRTGQWFYTMIGNLGLATLCDDREWTNKERLEVYTAVNRFMNNEYAANGKGGLFYIPRTPYDLRQVEIWYQMCWYLDSLIET